MRGAERGGAGSEVRSSPRVPPLCGGAAGARGADAGSWSRPPRCPPRRSGLAGPPRHRPAPQVSNFLPAAPHRRRRRRRSRSPAMLRRRLPLLGPGLLLLQVRGRPGPPPSGRAVAGCAWVAVTGAGGGGSSRRGEWGSFLGGRRNPGTREVQWGGVGCGGGRAVWGVRFGGCRGFWGGCGSRGKSGWLGGVQRDPGGGSSRHGEGES